MKHILVALLFFSVLGMACAKDASPWLDNPLNKRGYPSGSYSQLAKILERDKLLSEKELTARLSDPKASVYEISYGLYYLGLKAAQANRFADAARLWRVAADQYLNPYAMVKMAKLYYGGKKSIPGAGVDKDLDRSFYYISLAIQLAGVTEKVAHDNTVLTAVTGGGLGLYDTFGQMDAKTFDSAAAGRKFAPVFAQHEKEYTALYHNK